LNFQDRVYKIKTILKFSIKNITRILIHTTDTDVKDLRITVISSTFYFAFTLSESSCICL